MGFLDVGTPLSWEDSESVRDYVKRHGLMQFLNIWNKNKDRYDGQLRWGEEVEYSLVEIDTERSCSRVYVDAADIIEELTVREHIRPRPPTQLSSDWHPEFGNHMIEAIPSPPYPLNANSLLMIEPSMRLRRAKVQSILPPQKFVSSQTAFPRFGLENFMTPVNGSGVNPDESITRSIFIPDELINPHPRFGTLVNNIRSRRGAKPVITVPVYKDANTFNQSYYGMESDWTLARDIQDLDRFEVERLARQTINPIKGQIYMDCFAFGMGMSCVQTTFATPDCSSGRYLYDQLAVLAPLFLALTASTPVLRGLLADTDTRWSTLEQAVDCRKEEEMENIAKSRYSGISMYISDSPRLAQSLSQLNDTNPPINEKAKIMLMEEGVDEILATHYGHLWIRDPMVIFGERIELDDTKAVDHFENIQSTNWNSVRFKPPPPTPSNSSGSLDPDVLSPIGWRVEFRTPEIQLTDFDNAAGVAFISVLARMILSHGLDLYIPMSLNDTNMKRSWIKDAVTNERFWFRNDISNGTKNWEVTAMTLHQILTGLPRVGFKGLVPLCEEFMSSESAAGRCGQETRLRFRQYCELLTQRTFGKLMTGAQYLRKFVLNHPSYRRDSVVNPTINHDLTVLSVNIGFGTWAAAELHGQLSTLIPQTPLPAGTVLPGFSSVLMESSTVFFTNNPGSSLPTSSPSFELMKRRMIVLNEIDGIYTMPVGVTSRFGATSRASTMMDRSMLHDVTEHSTKCQGLDLFNLAFGEIMNNHSFANLKTTPSAPALEIDKAEDEIENKGQHQEGASCVKYTGKRVMATSGAISSEDFTRCWLLKGFDFVGNGPVLSNKTAKENFIVQLKKSACLVCNNRNNNGPSEVSTGDSELSTNGTLTAASRVSPTGWNGTTVVNTASNSTVVGNLRCTCNSSQSLQDLLLMQLRRHGKPYCPSPVGADDLCLESTACPSSVCCDCEIEDDLIHELSRSLSLGFDTEEDLEYFKQVCESSA